MKKILTKSAGVLLALIAAVASLAVILSALGAGIKEAIYCSLLAWLLAICSLGALAFIDYLINDKQNETKP